MNLNGAITTIEAVPDLLAARREHRRLSVRACAKEIGISFSTVSRIENGEYAEIRSYLAVLRWLNDMAEIATQEANT